MKLKYITISSFFITVPAFAGVVMSSKMTMTTPLNLSQTSKAYMDGNKLRVETTGGNMDQTMIFRGDKNVLWTVNTKAGTYTVSTPEDMQQMNAKLNELRGKMGKPAQDIVKPNFQKVSSGEKVDQWTCDKYSGTLSGQMKQEIWTTTPSSVGLSSADFQAMQAMRNFFKDSSKNQMMGFQVGPDTPQDGMYAGIPVKTMIYKDGQLQGQSQLIEIHKQNVDSILFELPAGYKKQTELDFKDFKMPQK